MGWTVLRLSVASSWHLGHLEPCSSELWWQQAVLGFLQHSLISVFCYLLRLGKDCIRQDDRAHPASLILLQCGKGIEGALWNIVF